MNACITWWGSVDVHGYGRVSVRGKREKAHRLIYEECLGQIPEGSIVHHECENRACVNPSHLAVVTRGEHAVIHDTIGAARAASNRSFAERTHCRNGHSYLPDNLYIDNGHRRCKTCTRENQRRYRDHVW